jgi:hypothetical protein
MLPRSIGAARLNGNPLGGLLIKPLSFYEPDEQITIDNAVFPQYN